MSRHNDSSRNAPDQEGSSAKPDNAQAQPCDREDPEGSCLSGKRILPRPIQGGMAVSDLIRETFLAYNGARLREACRLLAEKMMCGDVTVGLAVSGALTPAGLGLSALSPLLRNGYVDWVVSTGANLYHDTHFGLDLAMHQGSPHMDDRELRSRGVVRIYDILFDYEVLLSTDAFYRELITTPPFQKILSTAEFHFLVGRYLREREKALGVETPSFLSTAWECGVPVYTSSPGDSSIGMNVAASALTGNRLILDPNQDVNETAALVLDAKRRGKSAVWILGGGSPKNFVLQTEPQIQEVLGIEEDGHDYFLQITDARPDTGGLSGATPSEAVSWGKVDPEMLPHAVVAYVDSTIALPLLTAYLMENASPRPLKRLYDRRSEMLEDLTTDYLKAEMERRQNVIQQRMQMTQSQFETLIHDAQAQIEERMRQKQSQFEERIREVHSQVSSEATRLQQQLQETIHRLFPISRPQKPSDEADETGRE